MSPRGGKRPGAGRKPKYVDGRAVQIPVYLPESVIEMLDKEAERRGLSRSEVILRSLVPEA